MDNMNTEEQNKHRKTTHWPVICLGMLVAIIFLVVLFVFQVHEADATVLKRLGKPLRDEDGDVRIYEPGLHFKLPFIDQVWVHDNRLRSYELTRGQVEQVTSDDYQVMISTFVFWRVGDPFRFLNSFSSTTEAESKLDEIIRNSRNSTIAEYSLHDMVNVDPEQLKLDNIEEEMLEGIREVAMREYGIEITHLGIKHLGFPEVVTSKVFERMIEERGKRIQGYRSKGEEEGERIKTNADLEAEKIITKAEAEAIRIRGEGDRQAAEEYGVFRKHPELASFLRKLGALRRTLGEKTTLVIDTGTPPYDLLRPGAFNLDKTTELEDSLPSLKPEKQSKDGYEQSE